MPLEEIELFFKKNRFFSWISLTGGEIFIRNDIYDICKIICDNANDVCFLTFPTNGLLTDRIVETAEKISKLRFDRIVISVSLDGPPHLHDKIRGVDNAWNKAMSTFTALKRIKARNLSVNFGYTLSNYNMLNIDEAIKSASAAYPDLSSKDFHINLAFNAERYMNLDNADIIIKDYKELMRQLDMYQKKKMLADSVSLIDYLHVRLLKKYLLTKKVPLPCLSLASSCLIDSDWTVYPCFNFSAKVGNLKEVGFELERLWSEPMRNKIRNDIRQMKCPHCWTPCEAYQTILGSIKGAIFER